MKEPNWDQQPVKFNRPAVKGDVVWVKKKTRGRFGKLEVAAPGDHGIVISTWTSSMGSPKICILTHDLRELATTESCAGIFTTIKEDPSWEKVRLDWMTATYVPIIIVREEKTRRPRGAAGSDPHVLSRDKTSMLVKLLSSEDRLWISQDKMHPDDWEAVIGSRERCHSVRVPQWLAKKSGVFGNGK